MKRITKLENILPGRQRKKKKDDSNKSETELPSVFKTDVTHVKNITDFYKLHNYKLNNQKKQIFYILETKYHQNRVKKRKNLN